jgi:hypothetical protein
MPWRSARQDSKPLRCQLSTIRRWDVRSREEAAVGKHAAADGDSVHPVVAAALARRVPDAGAHHADVTQRIDGSLGWPGEPLSRDGVLGWPGDLGPDGPITPASGETDRSAEADEDAPEEPAPPLEHEGRRRGWRRLLGLDRAA